MAAPRRLGDEAGTSNQMDTRRIEHTFDGDPETYWDNFFSPEYNHGLFVGRLKFESWDVVEKVDTADGFRRVIDAVPRVGDLPGPIKALLKNGAGYREEGEYFRSEGRYTTRIRSKSLGDRLPVEGVMTVKAIGEGRCQRVYVFEVDAKVRLVGGMLEKLVLDNVEKSYNKAAEFTERWLAQKKTAAT